MMIPLIKGINDIASHINLNLSHFLFFSFFNHIFRWLHLIYLVTAKVITAKTLNTHSDNPLNNLQHSQWSLNYAYSGFSQNHKVCDIL